MITRTLAIIPRNIIKNKKRTLAIACSIILSIILITSMEILIRSIIKARVTSSEKFSGIYHGKYYNLSEEQLELLSKKEEIDRIGTSATLGYDIEEKFQFDIIGVDKEAESLLNFQVLNGKLPVNEDEIVVEEWLYKEIYKDKSIGDKIKISCELLTKDQEENKIKKEFEFKLVGIINNLQGTYQAKNGKAYTTLASVAKLSDRKKLIYQQFFTLENKYPSSSTLEEMKKENKKIGLLFIELNNSYLNALSLEQKTKEVVLFMDIIIALGAAMIIYNIFNMGVAERIKQFGLLKAVGITPLQIRILVVGEGVLLGVLLIPLGIFMGVNIIKFMVYALGSIGNRMLIIDSTTYSIPIIYVIGLATIVVAAIKPAKIAAEVSVIEALNIDSGICKENANEDSLGLKIIKTVFGYTGKMAVMNIMRNKKRFRTTVISIGIGVAIFITVNYFLNSLNPLRIIKDRMESDFVLKIDTPFERIGYSASEIKEIEAIEGVERVTYYKLIQGTVYLKRENITEDGLLEIQRRGTDNLFYERSLAQGRYPLNIQVVGCSKEDIEKIHRENSIAAINVSNKSNKKPAISIQYINNRTFSQLRRGDRVEVLWAILKKPVWEHVEGKFVVENSLDSVPFKYGGIEGDVIFITEEINIEELFGLDGYQRVMVYLSEGADFNTIKARLQDITDNEAKRSVVSFKESLDEVKRTMFQISTILYVLFLTAAFTVLVNIINTINMNIITRRREFGMLRAVGITKGQLLSMIIMEGVVYGVVGSIIGTILGLTCAYQIYLASRIIDSTIIWEMRPELVSIVFFVTTLITVLSTIVPFKKITSVEIVEAIQTVE